MQYGVTYYVSVRANYAYSGTNYGYSDYSTENPCTTAPKTPNLKVYSTSSTHITVSITDTVTNYTRLKAKITWKNATTTTVTADANKRATFTGTLDTTYAYKIEAWAEFDISGTTLNSIGTATLYVTPGIDLWAWEYEISSKQPFYNQDSTAAYLMRAAHWNDFTTRINQVRVAKGLATYSFTTATTSTTEAGIRSCINQAIQAINALGYSQSTVASGDLISANVFNTMRDNLNDAIGG